jgi:branched-subunit amino acid transport protein AzlD
MHDLLLIGVVTLVTVLIRAFPFLVLKNKHYPIIEYLGEVLPFAIMAMLVVYCLKDVNILTGNHGICEIIGVGSVILLHLLKRNTLISIFGGTLIYMLCVQVLFI